MQHPMKKMLAWAPPPDREPSFLNPSKEARRILGAIEVPKGTKLTWEVCLDYLATRLDSMIETHPDPQAALDQIWEAYESLNYGGQKPTLEESPGTNLVEMLRTQLERTNVFSDLPVNPIVQEHSAAREYLELDLEAWTTALTIGVETPR